MNYLKALEHGQTICEAALYGYGRDAQVIMALEEMSELQNELCKTFRCRSSCAAVSEEIADTLIMLQQMIICFDIEETVERNIAFKLGRLNERLIKRGVISDNPDLLKGGKSE